MNIKRILLLMVIILVSIVILPVKTVALERNYSNVYILDKTTTNKKLSESEVDDLVKKNNLCEDGGDIKKFIDEYWGIILILAPGLLIMMLSIDFFKAIMSSDDDLLKKASNNAVKRTAAMILLMMLPYILRTLFGWAGFEFCL